ncbi:hypothetical protein LINPERHAP1_LOCUS21354 [Linum perenne]
MMVDDFWGSNREGVPGHKLLSLWAGPKLIRNKR